MGDSADGSASKNAMVVMQHSMQQDELRYTNMLVCEYFHIHVYLRIPHRIGRERVWECCDAYSAYNPAGCTQIYIYVCVYISIFTCISTDPAYYVRRERAWECCGIYSTYNAAGCTHVYIYVCVYICIILQIEHYIGRERVWISLLIQFTQQQAAPRYLFMSVYICIQMFIYVSIYMYP